MFTSPQTHEQNRTLLLLEFLIRQKTTSKGAGRNTPIFFTLKELGSIFGDPEKLEDQDIIYLWGEIENLLDNEKLIEVMDATDPNIIDYKDFIESYRTGGGISLKYDYENLKKFYLELRSLLELGQAGLPIDKLVQPDNPNPKPALNFETAKAAIPRFPYKLAARTKWGHILFAFDGEDDKSVVIHASGHEPIKQNFIQMGFLDKRTKNLTQQPDTLWGFFLILAKNAGEIIPEQVTQQLTDLKTELTDRLQEYFQLESDPFYPWDPELPNKPRSSYKTRFMISYPAEIKKKKDILETNKKPIDPFIDLKDFMNEQNPQM
jgi:hypothetical protein